MYSLNIKPKIKFGPDLGSGPKIGPDYKSVPNSKSKKFLFRQLVAVHFKGPFPLRAWKRAFFLSFIDLQLKRAVKIEASAKKKQ